MTLNRVLSPEKPRNDAEQITGYSSSLATSAGTAVHVPHVPQASQQSKNALLFVPEVEEIRVSSVVSRKGNLNFLKEKTNGWVKRWVVS